MQCATWLEIAIGKWSKDNKCCRLVHKIKASKMFAVEISEYFYHKGKGATNRQRDKRARDLTAGEEKNKTSCLYRIFWKLSNIIKNQINTYISSLFTCPVIWEQKRPMHLGSHPNCAAPLISPLVYVLWLAPLLLCTLLPSPGNCDDKNSPNGIVVIVLEKCLGIFQSDCMWKHL